MARTQAGGDSLRWWQCSWDTQEGASTVSVAVMPTRPPVCTEFRAAAEAGALSREPALYSPSQVRSGGTGAG